MKHLSFSIALVLHLSFVSSSFAADVVKNGVCYGLIGTRWAFVTHFGLEPDAKKYSGRVVIPSQITHDGHTYSVISVGENAFAGSDELVSVQLPSTVRALSACAFLGCTALRQVALPENIQAFASCAFTGCTSLQQVTLPRHTDFVDTLTFYCCASLKSVVLPHRIRTVCQGALEHLPALTDLYCYSSEPPVAEAGAFTPSDQRHCTLHVPADAVASYQAAPLWNNFYRIVALSDADYTRQNYQRGDINDDGQIDAADLALLRRVIVRLPDDAAVRWAADINTDGIVNAVDYVTLMKKLKN